MKRHSEKSKQPKKVSKNCTEFHGYFHKTTTKSYQSHVTSPVYKDPSFEPIISIKCDMFGHILDDDND